MTRSSYQVHAEVRRVFARHWIDLDRIHFGVYRDMLRATGELHTTQPGGQAGMAPLLQVLHGELQRIPEIRCVQLDFDNWARDDEGRWVERRGLVAAGRRAPGMQADQHSRNV